MFGFTNFTPTSDTAKSFLELRKSKNEEELKTKEWKSLEETYVKHLKWRFTWLEKAYRQQLHITSLIAAMVFLLVLIGLSFSFFQLYSAVKISDLSSLESQIAVESATKLATTSSLIGASVLIISFIFFYLYLKYIFQIKAIIFPDADADTEKSETWE